MLGIFLFIVIVVVLVKAWPAIRRELFHEDDPYWAEGRLGNYTSYYVDQRFRTHTVGGFHVQYRIRGTARKEDNEAFKAARMLDDGAMDRLFDNYNADIVSPILARSLVVFEWGTLSNPVWVFQYRAENGESPAQLHFDAANIGITRLANAEAERRPWRVNGCSVDVMLFDFEVDDERSIQENVDMLSKEELAAALTDPSFLLVKEHAMVAALREFHNTRKALRLAQREQKHTSDGLKIVTTGSGRDQKIQWERRGRCKSSDWELIGFRETDGFSGDPTSEYTGSGRVRVVHSKAETGEIVDRLEEGRTHYYTFVLKNRADEAQRAAKAAAKEKTPAWLAFLDSDPTAPVQPEWLRFTVTATNAAQEQAELEAAIDFEELRAKIALLPDQEPPPVDPRMEKWGRNKAFLAAKMKMRAELQAHKRAALEETKSSIEFRQASEEEQAEWLGWLEREFESQAEQIKWAE